MRVRNAGGYGRVAAMDVVRSAQILHTFWRQNYEGFLMDLIQGVGESAKSQWLSGFYPEQVEGWGLHLLWWGGWWEEQVWAAGRIRSSILNMLSFRCLFEVQMEKQTRFGGDVYDGHLICEPSLIDAISEWDRLGREGGREGRWKRDTGGNPV